MNNIRLRSPIDLVNVITVGGHKPSTFTELFGPPKSGKSCYAYQSASIFLQDFPDGYVLIIDAEGALDADRMEFAFGIDFADKRLKVVRIPVLEHCFKKIEFLIDLQSTKDDGKLVKDKNDKYDINEYPKGLRPVLVIWDTIAACPTENEFESGERWTGGRGERQQLIKFHMMILMQKLHYQPMWIFIINQIYETQGQYTSITSPGGHALKHDNHYNFMFKRKTIHKTEVGDVTYQMSELNIEKSRFCIEVKKTPIYIDVLAGGVIDTARSLANVGISRGFIIQPSKGWYCTTANIDAKGMSAENKQRWKLIEVNEEVLAYIRSQLEEHYRKLYRLINHMYLKKEKELQPAAAPPPETSVEDIVEDLVEASAQPEGMGIADETQTENK